MGAAEQTHRAGEGEPTLFLAAEQLWAHTECGLGPVEELVAVRGIPRRAGRDGAHDAGVVTIDLGAVLGELVDRPRDRFGRKSPGCIDAGPEPRDPDRSHDRAAAVGDEQIGGVGADVDRSNRTGLRAHRAVSSTVANRLATHAPTGSSPPARYQA